MKIRRGLLSLALASGALLAVAPASPAHACSGEICDSFCDWWTSPSLIPGLDLTKGDCPLR